VLNKIPFLLTDTVGFIRKLPTLLIESFKSTLDEIIEADILVHVVDISAPDFENQIEVVNQTLIDIGATDKPTIMIYNKIDLMKPDEQVLEEINQEHQKIVGISAAKKINIDKFTQLLYDLVVEKYYVLNPNYLS
jgi:GTP-binding protein HflX